MGKRVHVIKKREVYGNTEAFNWKSEKFFDLLGDLGCEVCHKEFDYDDFECVVSEYKTAVKLARAYKKYGFCARVEKMFEEAGGYLEGFELELESLGGIDNVLSSMESFYKERDKRSSWIGFSAW